MEKITLSFLNVYNLKSKSAIYPFLIVIVLSQIYRLFNLAKIPFFSIQTQNMATTLSLTSLAITSILSLITVSIFSARLTYSLPYLITIMTLLSFKLSKRLLSSQLISIFSPHKSIRTAETDKMLIYCNLLSKYQEAFSQEPEEGSELTETSDIFTNFVSIFTSHGLSKCMVDSFLI